MNTRRTPRNKMTGFLMRGKVDTSDIESYPDSNYWAMSARGALKRLRIMYGCEIHNDFLCKNDDCRVTKFTSNWWNDDSTWMDICLKTERARDLFKALAEKEGER